MTTESKNNEKLATPISSEERLARRREMQQKRPSGRRLIWIGVSFLASSMVLCWAFTLPFRKPDHASLSPAPKIKLTAAELAEQKITAAQEYQDVAIALDQEFMRKLEAKKQPLPEDLPGREEVKAAWEQVMHFKRRQIRALSSAPQGSSAWEYRQELIDSLDEDVPE